MARNKQPIYTLGATNIYTGEDVLPMYLSKIYYNPADAQDDAVKFADEQADNTEDVIEISVYAGEYEDVNTGDILCDGDTYDFFTATNVSRERSMAARKAENYVKIDGLDYYAGE